VNISFLKLSKKSHRWDVTEAICRSSRPSLDRIKSGGGSWFNPRHRIQCHHHHNRLRNHVSSGGSQSSQRASFFRLESLTLMVVVLAEVSVYFLMRFTHAGVSTTYSEERMTKKGCHHIDHWEPKSFSRVVLTHATPRMTKVTTRLMVTIPIFIQKFHIGFHQFYFCSFLHRG